MIVKRIGNLVPKISTTARAAENAAIIGDVTLGENVSLWYSCTLRGDDSSINIGENSNIQDNCVLHSGPGRPVRIGKNVVVGHGAIVHGCTVEDGCLIGMGSTILDGAVIGEGSIVGAGALVTERKVIPPGSLVMGVPARVVRELSTEEREKILRDAAFYVRIGQEELPLIDSVE